MTHLGGYLHDYNLEKRVAELDWLWDTIREREDSEIQIPHINRKDDNNDVASR